jgi:hypothetical protein
VRGNPAKQGRPPHVNQTHFIAAIRMVLDVEVHAGNQTASQYAQPGLWAWLDRRPHEQWPKLVRGDIAWGTARMLLECEKRSPPYLFKIRPTTKVKRHIAHLFGRGDWAPAGGGRQGLSSALHLTGWSRKRWVVMLRRRVVRIRGAGNAGGGTGLGSGIAPVVGVEPTENWLPILDTSRTLVAFPLPGIRAVFQQMQELASL